ncbi:MAG: hypothetical protein J6Q84_07360 [Kiritimatiellae bacterium]|nr:hypothetical protein [Kiritimatiellia bacterium]
MWAYNHTTSNELYHYGVPGMKWGVRRALRKEAKRTYKKRTKDAFDEYEREINDIEKSYKRGQTLSKEDLARSSAAEKKFREATKAAKAEYKEAKRATQMSRGARVALTALGVIGGAKLIADTVELAKFTKDNWDIISAVPDMIKFLRTPIDTMFGTIR